MIQPYEVLGIAAQLAILTYYLGALLYALPLPDYRLKKWASVLIRDGIWMAVLISSYTIILYASDKLAEYSGYSITSVMGLASNIINYVYSANFILRLASAVLSVLPGSPRSLIYAMFMPFFFLQYVIFWSALSILVIAMITLSGKSLLASIGIALMSIPFRIGRSAGASLLAFILVSNAMLPYFPSWFTLIGKIMGASYAKFVTSEANCYTFWGLIHDHYGGYPSISALYFRGINGINYVFKVKSDGSYIIAIPYCVKPGEYEVSLDYMALTIPLKPSRIDIPNSLVPSYAYVGVDYRLDLEAPQRILFLRPYGVLTIPRSCAVVYSHVEVGHVLLTLSCASNSIFLTLRIPEFCKANLYVYPANSTWSSSKLTPWRGVMVEEKQFFILIRHSTAYIDLRTYCSAGEYSPSIREGAANRTPSELTPLLAPFLVFPIAAFSYITLIGMVSLSLARFLGAVSPRVVFDL